MANSTEQTLTPEKSLTLYFCFLAVNTYFKYLYIFSCCTFYSTVCLDTPIFICVVKSFNLHPNQKLAVKVMKVSLFYYLCYGSYSSSMLNHNGSCSQKWIISDPILSESNQCWTGSHMNRVKSPMNRIKSYQWWIGSDLNQIKSVQNWMVFEWFVICDIVKLKEDDPQC